jgi:DNA (cytosine-5)-methyltransferase 1
VAETVVAADLFAGAGGTSTGFAAACREAAVKPDLLAINCWPEAIEVHQTNHPWARHVCQRIEAVRPEDYFEDASPTGLLASPECTWHSTARGGKPINDQLRSSPWVIPRWLDAFDLEWFIIENVPGFRNWGKLDDKGRPVKALKGQIFRQYDQVLRSYGYNGEWRVLDSADFGAFTSRPRLFGLFRRGSKPVHWPRPTHSKAGKVPGTASHRAVRECLDFSLETRSIFEPPHLALNTLVRINTGTRKQWGIGFESFIDQVYGTELAKDAPHPGPQGAGPLILGQHGGVTARSIGEAAPTLAAGMATSVFNPVLVPLDPFLRHCTHTRDARTHNIDAPAPTITAANRGEIAVVQPMLMNIDRQLPDQALTSHERVAFPPLIVPNKGERPGQEPRYMMCDRPFWVYTATGNPGTLVQGMLVGYNGNGQAHPVSEPARTQSTRDRYLFVIPVVLEDGSLARLDIRHRMLHWREGARIMGFPEEYDFCLGRMVEVPGRRPRKITQTDIKKMVGNAVETNMARALALSQIRGRPMDVPQASLVGAV